jgi:hypothetical protein
MSALPPGLIHRLGNGGEQILDDPPLAGLDFCLYGKPRANRLIAPRNPDRVGVQPDSRGVDQTDLHRAALVILERPAVLRQINRVAADRFDHAFDQALVSEVIRLQLDSDALAFADEADVLVLDLRLDHDLRFVGRRSYRVLAPSALGRVAPLRRWLRE